MTWADRWTRGTPSSWPIAARRPPGRTHLAAYDLALREGADGVECDVRLTRDGHLVCVHDRKLDRTSSGAGLVSAMTLASYASWNSVHGMAVGAPTAVMVTLVC